MGDGVDQSAVVEQRPVRGMRGPVARNGLCVDLTSQQVMRTGAHGAAQLLRLRATTVLLQFSAPVASVFLAVGAFVAGILAGRRNAAQEHVALMTTSGIQSMSCPLERCDRVKTRVFRTSNHDRGALCLPPRVPHVRAPCMCQGVFPCAPVVYACPPVPHAHRCVPSCVCPRAGYTFVATWKEISKSRVFEQAPRELRIHKNLWYKWRDCVRLRAAWPAALEVLAGRSVIRYLLPWAEDSLPAVMLVNPRSGCFREQ